MRVLIYDTSHPDAFVIGASLLAKKGVDVQLLNEEQLLPCKGVVRNLLPLIYRSIKKVLLKIKPSIIHIHGIRLPVAICFFRAAKQLKIPIVATVHSYKLLCPISLYVDKSEEMPCKKPYPNNHCVKCLKSVHFDNRFTLFAYRLYMPLVRSVYRRADVLIAISRELSLLFREVGFNNVVYLPNPVTIRQLNNAAAPKSCLNAGFLGQLKDYKGVHFLPKIAEHFPDLNLHVAGWGPLQEWVSVECERHENVFFHGYLGREELLDFVESLDIILVPSVVSEACPGVVLEAFAQGKPVVCFDFAGQAELVSLADAGLVVKPFILTEFFDKINGLMSDPSSRLEFGLNGRRWVERNCSPEKFGDSLIHIYETALSV